MASPFAIFRKNQRVLLSVFGILIMFVFIVGSPQMIDWVQSFGSQGFSGKAVTWRGGGMTDQELGSLHRKHLRTVGFLRQVLEETEARKGRTKISGATKENPGISLIQNPDDMVRTLLLARKGEQMGMSVNDAAVKDFLNRLCDGQLAERDLAAALKEAAGTGRNGGYSPQQIFDHLRMELLARNVMSMLWSGTASNSPGKAWEYYNRLNRRVETEVLTLNVADYKSQVKEEPNEAQITELYEKYKEFAVMPGSPLPGFRQRRQLVFNYYKIEFQRFLDAELPKVTDEEIQKEYDTGISRGEYKVVELPGTKPAKKETVEDDPKTNSEGETKKDEGKPDAPKSESEPPAKTDSPEEKKSPPADPPADAPKSETPAKEKEADKKPDGSSLNRATGTFLVSTAADGDETPQTEKAAGDKVPAADPPATPDKPDAPKDDASAKDATATKDSPAESKPDEEKKTTEEEAKPKFKPLSEVRDLVKERIAKPRAQEAKKKAMEQAKKEVERFGNKLSYWKSFHEEDSSLTKPVFDFEAKGEEWMLTFGKTGPLDELTVQEHELGKNNAYFRILAFQMQVPAYRPQVPYLDSDVDYLWWKTEEIAAKVPDLKEVREAVIDAWKKTKALELAKKDAEAKASEARDKESLKDLFGDKVITPAPFSWLSTGAMAYGYGGNPTVTNLDDIDTAGNGFMEKVFSLKPGEVGVAVNQPETIVSVVHVIKEISNASERQEKFLAPGSNMTARMLASREHSELFSNWLEELEKEANVNWHRRPGMMASYDQ